MCQTDFLPLPNLKSCPYVVKSFFKRKCVLKIYFKFDFALNIHWFIMVFLRLYWALSSLQRWIKKIRFKRTKQSTNWVFTSPPALSIEGGTLGAG